jgi:hypothetical protein
VQFFQRGKCTKTARSSPGFLGRGLGRGYLLGLDYLGQDYLGGEVSGTLKTLVDLGDSVLSDIKK